ncbi:MAG: glutathione S-transferase [Myxococcota bacterium]
MTDLRIFSYLPNPRIWKATIAARLCGVEVEVRGAKPTELPGWLWDFDARPLSEAERASASDASTGRVGFGGALHKTAAFLDAHPFGTVPAAWSPDGRTGIFESNSIMRAVARLGEKRCPLYGADAYEASRVDGFLDASLVFARDAQLYLLALLDGTLSGEIHARAQEAFEIYAGGIDRALAPDRAFLVGANLTLADICFAAELCLFMNERGRRALLGAHALAPIVSADAEKRFARAFAHFARLRAHPAFAPELEPYLAKLEAGAR